MPYPSETEQTIADGFYSVCEIWSLDDANKRRLLGIGPSRFTRKSDMIERMLIVMGISIGLGDLFDDDFDAEVEWLEAPRNEFRGRSSLEHMLEGDFLNIRDVADLLEQARGLR